MKLILNVKEMETMYTVHDWVKGLFHTCINEFLEGYYPEICRRFTGPFKPLQSEYLEHLTRKKGNSVNIGMKTKFDKEDTILFIHIAWKKTPISKLDQWMKNTIIELQNRYLYPVLPILVTLHENEGLKEFASDSAEIEFQTYHYSTVHIKKSKWKEYMQRKNIIALALLHKFAITEWERFQLEYELLWNLVNLQEEGKDFRSFYRFFIQETGGTRHS